MNAKGYVFIGISLLFLASCLDYAALHLTAPTFYYVNPFMQWPMKSYFLALSLLVTGSVGDLHHTHRFLFLIGEISYIASILARFFLSFSKVLLGRLLNILWIVLIPPLGWPSLYHLISKKEQGTVLAKIIFFIGLISITTLFFDLIYLHGIKDKADFILLAIPIYVALLAFFVGKPIDRLGPLHIILFGLVLTCFSIFFQIFYFSNTSITHVIFSFIWLSSMWSFGSTLSFIINNTRHLKRYNTTH